MFQGKSVKYDTRVYVCECMCMVYLSAAKKSSAQHSAAIVLPFPALQVHLDGEKIPAEGDKLSQMATT